METGTHNPQQFDLVSTCRIDDGVEALVIGHTYQKPTGDGRHWLLMNLPERSSCTLYLGANPDIANEIHAAVLKAGIEAIRFERAAVLKLIREEAQRKLAQARVDNAPATYCAGIEGVVAEIEAALLEGTVLRG